MPICTVTYKSIRTLNCNEIHLIRKFWFYWKFVPIYLKQRFCRRNILSLWESEIYPKNSKIFSILNTIIIIRYFYHNIFNITKLYLKTKNYWKFNFISLKWYFAKKIYIYLHIKSNLFYIYINFILFIIIVTYNIICNWN